MNTSFFDVLENTANVNILAIAQSINVTFNSTFKEAVELLTATRDKALKGKVEVYIPQQTLESWSKQLERLAADWKGQKNGR